MNLISTKASYKEEKQCLPECTILVTLAPREEASDSSTKNVTLSTAAFQAAFNIDFNYFINLRTTFISEYRQRRQERDAYGFSLIHLTDSGIRLRSG
jgi:hypothetical protein